MLCTNVGGSLSAGTYWVAISISYPNALILSELAGLGAV